MAHSLPEKFWNQQYGKFHVFVDYIDNQTRFQVTVREKGTEVDAPRQFKHNFWTIPKIKKEIAQWFKELGVWEEEDVSQILKEFSLSLYHQINSNNEKEVVEEENLHQLNETEEMVAQDLLTNPALMNTLKADMDRVIAGEDENKLLLYLIYLSTFLESKIHPRLSGDSSGGKSHMMNAVADYLPPETILTRATRLTGKALEYHLTGKDLNGRLMIIQEFEGGMDAVVSLRPLMSGDQEDGGLTLMTTKKDAAGNIVSNELKCTGTPLIASASTQFSLDSEFETRTWKFEIDDSNKQTRAVMKYIAENQINPDMHKTKMKKYFQDAVRVLRDKGVKSVKNLWALDFQDSIPDGQTRVRRDMTKLFGLIGASAFLHQLQRPLMTIGGIQYIIPTIDDFEIASKLYAPSSAVVFHNLSKKITNVYKVLKRLAPSVMVKASIIDIAKELSSSQKEVRDALYHLVDIGLAYSEQSDTDRRKQVYYVTHKDKEGLGVQSEDFNQMFTKANFEGIIKNYLNGKEFKCQKHLKSTPGEWEDITQDELYEIISTRILQEFIPSKNSDPDHLQKAEQKLKMISSQEEADLSSFANELKKLTNKSFIKYLSKFPLKDSNGFSLQDAEDYFGEGTKEEIKKIIEKLNTQGYIIQPYEDMRYYAL
tara:strand:- start:870 stop:2828 length:1959 start_codon:yes stop_codon:yes gene_type:complete